MPVIAFANVKGGSGKTTSALVCASTLAMRGAKVRIVDADPETYITRWAKLPGCPDNLTVDGNVTEDTIMDVIEEAERAAQFVIVDLEGSASMRTANAVAMADFVVVPLQGSALDAHGAVKMIKLIRSEERKSRRTIPYGVLLTKTNAAIMSRSLRDVIDQLRDAGVELFTTQMVERAAFRDIFAYGGLLEQLDPGKVSNLDKAVLNAREFTSEVLTKIKTAQAGKKVA